MCRVWASQKRLTGQKQHHISWAESLQSHSSLHHLIMYKAYIYIYIYISVSTGIRLTQVQATTADYGDRDQSASHSSKGKETSTERNNLGLRLLSHLDGCCIP